MVGRNLRRLLGLAVAASVVVVGAGRARATVNIATVPVGNPGNAPDTTVMVTDGTTGYGQVNYAYSIGKYDVTVGQYAAFLNAVAGTGDPQGLYNANMASGSWACGLAQVYNSGTGTYTYTATKNANFPVNYVSFWDACRFTNWLSNGQPSAPEGAGTTETGSYTLTTAGIANNAVTRNAGATWVVPNENEWYKAAYYDANKAGGAGYWAYSTKSNSVPDGSLSNAATDPNDANYYTSNYTDATNYLTAVGTFGASHSAYGTFDQSGDVFQWNEGSVNGSNRGLRGGAFLNTGYILQSGYRHSDSAAAEYGHIGFRVALVPEPGSLAMLGLGVMGMLVRRRGAGR